MSARVSAASISDDARATPGGRQNQWDNSELGDHNALDRLLSDVVNCAITPDDALDRRDEPALDRAAAALLAYAVCVHVPACSQVRT